MYWHTEYLDDQGTIYLGPEKLLDTLYIMVKQRTCIGFTLRLFSSSQTWHIWYLPLSRLSINPILQFVLNLSHFSR